jgi:hypothetical protein
LWHWPPVNVILMMQQPAGGYQKIIGSNQQPNISFMPDSMKPM